MQVDVKEYIGRSFVKLNMHSKRPEIWIYTAGAGKDTRLMLYAVDKTDGMYLAIDEIRIYEVR